MTYTTYRDGGTMSFKNIAFKYICKSEIDEVCIDGRMNAVDTLGQMTLGHPNNEGSRLLTPEEKLEITPIIQEGLEADIKWRRAYLKKFEEIIRTPEQKKMDEYVGLTSKFNYYFEVGDRVKFHPLMIELLPQEKHSQFMSIPLNVINKVGVVKDCTSDCHAFGRGSLYLVDVDFEGEVIKVMAGYFIKAD